MFCPNCDYETDDFAQYCPNCGKPIDQYQGNKKLRFQFLLLFIILGITITLGVLSYCQNSNVNQNKIVNFDLTKYKEHGNLACDRIWVIKEFSDWNTEVEEKFAYFDNNGNQISQWFSLKEYQHPRDFSNGYVIIIERATFEKIYDYSNCLVYNTNFYQVASLNCRNPNTAPHYITDFDSQGYSYALGYDHDKKDATLYWIDGNGAHAFEEGKYSYAMVDKYVLQNFKVSNNYFVTVCGSSDPNYLYTNIARIYNKRGALVLDIEDAMGKYSDDYAITSATVSNDKNVKIYFYGANKKRYVCVMDFNGNFVEAPTEA